MLFLVYYMGANLFLIDPEVMDLAPWQAIGISLASLGFGWVVYDQICKSRFGDDNTRLMLGLYLILVAMAWGFVVATRREAVWFMPLVCLTLAFALAACWPNPVIDGRATARRWAAAARRMGQP